MMNGPLRYTIGVDLGKSRNHTALVVLERNYYTATADEFIRSGTRGFQGEDRYTVVAADRLSLGTTYPMVASWVQSVAKEYGDHLGSVVVDASGVGSAVMDLLNRADLGVRPTGIVITGRQASAEGVVGAGGRTVAGYKTVSRTDLLTKLQVAIQEKRFQFDSAKCREWDAMRRELSLLQLEGKRSGTQDDLAFALALAVWVGLR
jgi:hypothetical protein